MPSLQHCLIQPQNFVGLEVKRIGHHEQSRYQGLFSKLLVSLGRLDAHELWWASVGKAALEIPSHVVYLYKQCQIRVQKEK